MQPSIRSKNCGMCETRAWQSWQLVWALAPNPTSIASRGGSVIGCEAFNTLGVESVWSVSLKIEKPFNCNECKLCCSQNGYLKLHVQTHPGDKNFECIECRVDCSINKYLKKHTETKQKEILSCTDTKWLKMAGYCWHNVQDKGNRQMTWVIAANAVLSIVGLATHEEVMLIEEAEPRKTPETQ